MTRAAQVTQAVSATRKEAVSATRKARAAPSSLPETASMTFLIFEDNGGAYHWTIVASDGATLVRSAGFASYEDAERAANRVRDGAASAPLEHRAASARPVDPSARRAATGDAADAERWLDEGGSFSGEAVAR
jgi:uncharacterized protein YegP (UPF0339 family)